MHCKSEFISKYSLHYYCKLPHVLPGLTVDGGDATLAVIAAKTVLFLLHIEAGVAAVSSAPVTGRQCLAH